MSLSKLRPCDLNGPRVTGIFAVSIGFTCNQEDCLMALTRTMETLWQTLFILPRTCRRQQWPIERSKPRTDSASKSNLSADAEKVEDVIWLAVRETPAGCLDIHSHCTFSFLLHFLAFLCHSICCSRSHHFLLHCRLTKKRRKGNGKCKGA